MKVQAIIFLILIFAINSVVAERNRLKTNNMSLEEILLKIKYGNCNFCNPRICKSSLWNSCHTYCHACGDDDNNNF